MMLENTNIMSNNKENEKEATFMVIAAQLKKEQDAYLNDMKKYIKSLKQLPQNEAAKKSKEALIRTGVIDKNGKLKENIVSWE